MQQTRETSEGAGGEDSRSGVEGEREVGEGGGSSLRDR